MNGREWSGEDKALLKPFNKGLRRPGWHVGRMRETQFRKGERSGIAAKNWRPIGTIRTDPDGYLTFFGLPEERLERPGISRAGERLAPTRKGSAEKGDLQ